MGYHSVPCNASIPGPFAIGLSRNRTGAPPPTSQVGEIAKSSPSRTRCKLWVCFFGWELEGTGAEAPFHQPPNYPFGDMLPTYFQSSSYQTYGSDLKTCIGIISCSLALGDAINYSYLPYNANFLASSAHDVIWVLECQLEVIFHHHLLWRSFHFLN